MKKIFRNLIISTQLFSTFSLLAQRYADLSSDDHWSIDATAWNHKDQTSETTMRNGILLMYSTLFCNHYSNPYFEVSEEEQEHEFQKISFLKKLYLLLILGELQYTSINNDEETSSWPFPMATALTQGQRVMLILEKNLPIDGIMSYLTNDSHIRVPRAFSSHGVKCKKGICIEVKLKNPLRQKSGLDSTEGLNYGIDIALGGVGNPLVNGDIIGPGGQQFSVEKNQFIPSTQLGHILIYMREFPKLDRSFLLIGLEGCAPGTTNLMGCSHNILSGMKNQRVNRCATGGRKWSGLKLQSIAPPAEYGGKRITLTRKSFLFYKRIIDSILSLPEGEQARLFKRLLIQDGKTALHTLKEAVSLEKDTDDEGYYKDE